MARDTLTRDQIVESAVGLLDEDGLDGLNMRALGKRLESAATAVYWHVGSKDDLVNLAVDSAWHEIALPDPLAVDWREAARVMATELHAMLARHPWVLHTFGSYLTYGYGKARYDDANLAIYERAGLTGAQADRAVTTMYTFVLGHALGTAAPVSLRRKLAKTHRDPEQAMRDRLAQAHQVARSFPRLKARLETPAADYASGPQDSFEFGLTAILDGLAALLGERQTH
jgi:AcrR family transcriptional regulator